ncbi:hypothetical protein AOXY_G70 [Acipenser oxyrinchus oxyrinchus]|uniref:Uncharacterized protein n=1 Tax=Acipenser oxyrinchus oxyrinchus TaxID=40147 RepID=A0AAD8LUB3_ACIOX|nr:hypothetical protein AOXY_G70 [Acipenser oxyrinchus oxyrinchus]
MAPPVDQVNLQLLQRQQEDPDGMDVLRAKIKGKHTTASTAAERALQVWLSQEEQETTLHGIGKREPVTPEGQGVTVANQLTHHSRNCFKGQEMNNGFQQCSQCKAVLYCSKDTAHTLEGAPVFAEQLRRLTTRQRLL